MGPKNYTIYRVMFLRFGNVREKTDFKKENLVEKIYFTNTKRTSVVLSHLILSYQRIKRYLIVYQ